MTSSPDPAPDDGAREIATLIASLSDEQLVALCRLSLDRPVRASDVPAGVPAPGPAELAVCLTEVGRRMAMRGLPELTREVMGASEAAEALGVGQTNLRTVKGLPEPVARIRATSLWDGAAIRQLAAERQKHRRG